MTRQWTFGERVAASLGLLVALAVVIGLVGFIALRGVVSSKDQVIDRDAQLLIGAQRVRALAEAKSGDARGFLLLRDDAILSRMAARRLELLDVLATLRSAVVAGDGPRLIEAIVQAEAAHQGMLDEVIAQRRTDLPVDRIAGPFEARVVPARQQLDSAIGAFIAAEERQLQDAKQASTAAARRAMTWTAVLVTLAALSALVAALILTRSLRRQIGTVVGHVQSSSTELQTAATQQAVGAKQQATAMNEIATTISELLATSRQITESARRVAQFAEETAGSARGGTGTVDQAHVSIGAIRRQVDLIVGHMLELGKKSQQSGTVLDIVAELAEQTNILAINATIEAAGAGEAGRRFAVVADEIRKLADRVAASTKEIRGLVDDIRSAVNTTVMATETGSKAVDAGSRHYAEVTTSFKQIVELVTTTTEAARQIELSIKQQMSAIEQVDTAINSIAQAARESEAGSAQTQQTASQLATVSRDLMGVIRPQQVA